MKISLNWLKKYVPVALDNAAYDLWALGAGIPAGLMLRMNVVRLEGGETEGTE